MPPFIGVLSLDTCFPRVLGDAGHPGSYHLPARILVVKGADSPDIVRDAPPAPTVEERFLQAALQLEDEGAVLITSTCGFLIHCQDRIATAVRVPVLLSALSLVPLAAAMTGGRPVGILTASRANLGPAALSAAGCGATRVHIRGLEHDPVFAATFLASRSDQCQQLNANHIGRAVLQAGRELLDAHPDIGFVVLECGNLPPYAGRLVRALGRPVLSILDGARMISPSGPQDSMLTVP